ncbi:MAG: type II toxin-antitoxin system CcdA family antitoxin [Dehalococcoidia bacterium]|nr:type II toxin-antitoxin system CcdA family antitoxin [Dehalococcoidia bacterium]
MPKVNVSLSQEVLQDLDKAAREANTSRSAFLARAVRHYLEERGEEQRQEERKEAAAAIDRFREEFGGWDGTTEVLKWRDSH